MLATGEGVSGDNGRVTSLGPRPQRVDACYEPIGHNVFAGGAQLAQDRKKLNVGDLGHRPLAKRAHQTAVERPRVSGFPLPLNRPSGGGQTGPASECRCFESFVVPYNVSAQLSGNAQAGGHQSGRQRRQLAAATAFSLSFKGAA